MIISLKARRTKCLKCASTWKKKGSYLRISFDTKLSDRKKPPGSEYSETADPQRNLPRAIIIGTLMIVAIYLLANAAYLYINPIGVMAKSPLIAADTMGALFGRVGVSFVSVVVMISTFGSLMGSMLASPRISGRFRQATFAYR